MKEKRWSLQEKRCRRKKFLPEEIEAGGYFTDTELNYTITKSAAYVCSRQESPSPVKTGKRSKSCDRISRNKTDLMNHETSLKESTSREKGKKVQKGFVCTEDGAITKSAAYVCSRQESPSPVKTGKLSKSCDRISRNKTDLMNHETSLKESTSREKGKKVQKGLVCTEDGVGKSAAVVYSRQQSPSPAKARKKLKSCDRTSVKKDKPDLRNQEASLKECPSHDTGRKVQKRGKSAANVCSRQKSPSPVKAEKRSKSCDRVSRKKDKPDFMNQERSTKERTKNAKDKGPGEAEKDKSAAKAGMRLESCDKVFLKKDESNFKNQENSMKDSLTCVKGKKVRKRLVGKVYGNEALPVKERHKCNHCDKTFIYLQSLRKHIFGKHQSYLEQSFGGKLYMSDGNKPETGEADWHIFAKEHGLLNNKPLHKCTFPNCGKTLLSADSLWKHHRNCHSESASYKCKLCGKRHFSSYILKMHEVSDHGLAMKSLATETHLNNPADGTIKSRSVQKKTVRFLIPSYHSRIKSEYVKKKMQNLRGILKLPKRAKCTSETAAKHSFHEKVSFTPSQHQPVTSLATNKEDIIVSGESDSSCDSSDVMSPFQALLSDKRPFLSSKHSSQKHPEFRKDNVGSNVIQTMPGESHDHIPQIYAMLNFHSDQTFTQKDTKQSAVGFHDCVSSNNSEKDSNGTSQDCVSSNYSEEECCGKAGYTSDHYSSDKNLANLQQELSFIRELRSKKNNGIYSSKSGTKNRKKRASNTIFKVSSEESGYNLAPGQTDFRVNDAETRSKYWTTDCTKNMTRKVLKILSKKLSHNLTSKTDCRVKSAKAKLDSRIVNETTCMNVLNSSLNESSHNLSVVHNTAAVENQANNAVISDKSKNIKSETGKKNNPISNEVKCKRSVKNKEDCRVSQASATDFKKNNMPIVHSLVDIKSGRVKIPGEYSHKFLPIVMLNKLNLKNNDPWHILHIDDGNGAECAGVLTKEEDIDLQHVKQSLRCNGSALDQDEDRNSSDSLDLSQSLESVASRPLIEGSDDDKIDKVSDTEISKDILPSNEILNNCIVFTNQSVKKKGRQPHINVALANEHETQHKDERKEKNKTDECHNSKTRRGSEFPCSNTVGLLPEVKNRKDTDSNKKEKDTRETSFLMKKSKELNWKSQDIVTEMTSVDVGATKQTKFESTGDKRLNNCILITNTSQKKKRGRQPQRSVVLASGQRKHDMDDLIENKKRDDCHNTKTNRGSKSPCSKTVSFEPEVKNRNFTDTDKTKTGSKETRFFKTSGDHNLESQEMVTELFSFHAGTAKQTNFESSFDISQTSQSNSIVCDQIESSQGKEIDRDTSISDANETLKTPYRKAMKKDSKIKTGKLSSRVVVTRNNNYEPAEKVKTVKKNTKTGTVTTNKSQNNSLKEKAVDENLIIEEKQNATKLNKVSYIQKTNSKDLKSVTGRRDSVKSKLSEITENDGETKSGNSTHSRSSKRIHSKFLTSECLENDSSDEEVLLNFKNNMDTNDSKASGFNALALRVQDKSQESEKRFLPLLDSSADSLNSITFFEGSDSKKSDESSNVGQNYTGSKVSSDRKVKNKMNKTIECNNSLGSATSFEEEKDTSLRGKKRKAKDTANLKTKAYLLGVVQSDLEKNRGCAGKTPDFRKELDLTEMDLAMCTSANSHSIEPQQPNNINNEIKGKVKVNAHKKSLKVVLKKCSKDVKYTKKSCKDGSRPCMLSLNDLLKTNRTKITKSTKQAKPKLKTSLEVSGSLDTRKRLRQNNNSNKSKLKKSQSKVLYLDKTLHTSHSLDPEDSAAKNGNSETVGKIDNMKSDSIDRNPQNEINSGRSRKLYEQITNIRFISKKETVNCSISESAKNMEHTCFETKNGDEVPKNHSENAQTEKTGMRDENLEKQKKPQITKPLIDETQPDVGDVICVENIVWNDETYGLSSSSFRTDILVPNTSNSESRKELSPVSSEEPVPDVSQENESFVTFEKLLEKVQPFHPEDLVSLVNIKDPTELAVNDSIQQSKSFEYEEEDDMETELDLTVLQQTTPDKQTALDGFTSGDLLELICLSDYQLELVNQISSKAEQEMREKNVEKGNEISSKEGIPSIKTDTNLQSNSKENMNLEEADVCSPAGVVCQSYVYKNQNNLTIQNSQTKTPEKEQNTEMMSDKSVTLMLLNKSNLETLSNTCQSSETDEDLQTDLDASSSLQTNLEAVLAKDEDLQMQKNKSQIEHIAQPKGESVHTVATSIPQEGTAENEEVSYKVVACLGRCSEKLTRPKDNHQRFRSTNDVKSDSDLATKSRSQKKVLKKLKIYNVQQMKEYTDKGQESSEKVNKIKKNVLLSDLLSHAPLVPSKPFTPQLLYPLIGSLRTAHSLNSTSSNKVTNLGGTVTECAPYSSPLKTPILETQRLGNQSAGLMRTTVYTNAEHMGTAVLTDKSVDYLNRFPSSSTTTMESYDNVVTGSTATNIEIEIVDPSSQHRCELCGNGYESVALLAKHFKIEHNRKLSRVENAKSYACQFCRSEFTTKKAMYVHMENFHSDKWTRPQKKDRRAQSRYVCKCGLGYQDKRFHKQHALHCALLSGCADIENPDQETAEAASFMQGQAFHDSSMEQEFHGQASTFVQKCSEIETDFNTVSDVICQQCGSKFLNLEALLNHQRLCGQKEPSTLSSIFESPMKKSFKLSCKNYRGKAEVQAVTNTLPLTEVGISSIIAIDQENIEAMPQELEVKKHTDTMNQKVIDSFIPDTFIIESRESNVLGKKMETFVDVYESFVLLYKIPLRNIFCWKSYKFKRCGSEKIQYWKMCNRKVSSGSSIEPCVSHLGSHELKKTAQACYREEQVTDFEKAISSPMDKVVKVKKAKKRDRQSSNDSIQSDPVVENKLHTIRVRLEEPILLDSTVKSKLASSILKKKEIKKKSMEDPLFQLSSKHQTVPPLVLLTKKADAQNSFKLKCFKKTGAAASSNSNEDMFYRSPLDRTFGNNKEKTWSACYGTWGQARPTDSRKDRLLKDLEDTGISLPYSHTSPKAYKAANPGDFMKFKQEHDALGRTSLTGLQNRSVDSVFQSTLTSSSLDHLTRLKLGRMPFMDSLKSCSFKVSSPLEADLFDVSSISKDSSLLYEKDTSLDSAIVPSPLAERGRCLSTSTMKDGFIFEGSKLPASFSQSMKYESSTKPRPTGSLFDLIKQSSRETSNKNVLFSEALDQERKSVKLASTNEANSWANRKRSWKKRPSCLGSGKESDKKRRRLTRFSMDEDSHDSIETTSLTSGSESSGRIQISDEKQTEKISVELHPAQQDCGEIQVCRNMVLRDSLKSQAFNSDEEDFEDLDIRSAECSQIDELDESFISTIHFTESSSHPFSSVKRPPYESAERMCNRVTKSPPFSSNIKVTVKDQSLTLIDVTVSGKSNGLDDVEKFEPDYADDIEESSVKNDTLDSDDCRVSCCESERISKNKLDQELKTSMEEKACSNSGNEQYNTEVLQSEIFEGKMGRDRSESLEVVTGVKVDLNSEAGEFEVVQVEQNERETSKAAENVEKFDCEESLEEKTVENGLECEGDDEDALSIYASSEASFLDDTVEEEEQPQLKSRTPSPVEEYTNKYTNNRTSHGPVVVTEQVVEKLDEITEMDNEDQSAVTSDLQVIVSVKNSSEERRPRFNADLYPKGCCFHFLAHGRCQKPNCNFSHKQPSQEEMLQHCLKKMKLLQHEGDVERLFTLYEDFRSKEMGHLPPQLLESLYQEAIMQGMVYQSYSLLEDLIRQHCSFVSDRVCMDFIRLCGSNSQHFDMVWNILKTMMALQYLPEGDVLIMTLRGCVDREDWDKLWELMLKCLDYNGFMIPVTFQAMALRAFVNQPRRFIEYAFRWLMKEPDSLNKLDKELLLKVANIFDGCGHKPLVEMLRAATKRSIQQVKSRSISPTDEACLNDAITEIDNEIMKENQHKIQTCKLTSNWHYLGRIFADVLTLESLNNSILLDNYTDALEQKTHRQSDPGCIGRAFKDFIATILTEFQEEKNVNVFAKLDIQTMSWIGNNLLLVCFDNQLWESGYEVLSTLVKAKIPYLKYKRHEHRNIPFITILIYLQNNDSKGAIGILDALCWDQFEKQHSGDWQFMLDVLMTLFRYVLEDRSHISARKVLIAILEQSKKASRFAVDINSHLHFQEYFNALSYCSLKVGDIDSALETYKLHESSNQLQPIDPLLLRAIVIGLVRSQHMFEAKDFFERCKAVHFLYENQSIVKPRRVRLDVTYNPEEIYLSIHDYLCCLYNYCCDQVYERKILTQEDLDLEILVQGNVDQQLFSMPYISGAPRSYNLAVKMIRRILQLEFKPSLETNIIAPDRIQISPNCLEKYLKEYDQKFGRRQGLMFKNVLHMALPLMPAPRVPRPGPGPRAFRGRRGVNRAEQSSFRIGGKGHIKPM